MSFESLNARISALQETTKHVSILIERLRKIDFQPGSLPLDLDDVEEEGNVVAELSQEIRDSLKEETESLELLEQEVGDIPGGKQGSHAGLLKEGLEQLLSKAQRDVAQSSATFHDALLTAKKNLAAAQELERNLVMEACKSPELPPTSSDRQSPISPISPTLRQITRPKPHTAEEKEVAASSDVTAALRRTQNLMLAELCKSQFANQTLEESTAALAELSKTYSTLETLLAGSKNLLGSLLQSQKSDTWYLETAVYVLVATICWLVFRRFFYPALWWFFWQPLRIFYNALMWVFVALGVRGGGGNANSRAAGGVTTVVQSEVPGLTVHNQARRVPKIEGQAGKRQPMIHVGGGGKGAPMRNRQPGQQVQEPKPVEAETIIEEVGQVIDGDIKADAEERILSEKICDEKTREPGTQATERQEEFVPNPKKRMYDTEVEWKKQEQAGWNKDDL